MKEHLLITQELPQQKRGRDQKSFLIAIALRVKELRCQAGITQEEFYIDTNIHIARIETGKHNISLSTLHRICSYLGLTIRDFFSEVNI